MSRVRAGWIAVLLPAAWAGCGGRAVDGTGTGGPSDDAGVEREGGSGGSGGAGSGSGAAASTGGVPPSYFACKGPQDCVIVENECCQDCGPQTAHDAIAVRHEFRDAFVEKLCSGRGPVACPDVLCEVSPPYVVPFCLEGRCTAIDIREDMLTACATAEQCRLRMGTACCWPCSAPPGSVVAVSTQVDFDAAVCGPEGGSCPECVGAPPPRDAVPTCVENHCTVQFLLL